MKELVLQHLYIIVIALLLTLCVFSLLISDFLYLKGAHKNTSYMK